jgi:hypothetical protein
VAYIKLWCKDCEVKSVYYVQVIISSGTKLINAINREGSYKGFFFFFKYYGMLDPNGNFS